MSHWAFEIAGCARGRGRSRSCGGARRAARGYSLIEALVASVLLGVIVLAVMSAVAASQKVAFESEKLMLGSITAGDLMGELVTLPYSDIRLRDGLEQPVGAMATLDGAAYPSTYWALGRRVTVTDQTIMHAPTKAQIKGVRVVVTAFDTGRDVASVETFVPEPAS
jgi:hypothetical protein